MKFSLARGRWFYVSAFVLVFSSFKASAGPGARACQKIGLEDLLNVRLPPELDAVIPHLEYGKSFKDVSGFTSRKSGIAHGEDHKGEVGAGSEEIYIKKAIAFWHANHRDIATFQAPETGDFFRYRISTGEYSVATKEGKIFTYYKIDNKGYHNWSPKRKAINSWEYFLSKYDTPERTNIPHYLKDSERLRKSIVDLNIPPADFIDLNPVTNPNLPVPPKFGGVPPRTVSELSPNTIHFMASRRTEEEARIIIESALEFRRNPPRLEELKRNPIRVWMDENGSYWTPDSTRLAAMLLSRTVSKVPVTWLDGPAVANLVYDMHAFTATNGNTLVLPLGAKRAALVRRAPAQAAQP